MKMLKLNRLRIKLIIITIVAIIIGFFYAEYETSVYAKGVAADAIKDVKVISDFIRVEEIEKWHLNESDLSNQYYKELKQSLTAFRLDSNLESSILA